MRSGFVSLHGLISDYVNNSGGQPNQGSIASVEQHSWFGSEELLTAHSQGHLLLESAGDHAYAITRLLTNPIQTIAPWTCVRASLEAAAYSCWLFASEIDARGRVARSLAFRYEDLTQQNKLAKCIDDHADVSRTEAQLDELEMQALGLGYKVLRNKKGKRIGIAVQMPSASECIGKHLDGEINYRICSSIAHSHATAIAKLSFFAPDANHPRIITKGLTPYAAGWILMLATDAFARTVWSKAELFGHDLNELRGILDDTYDVMGLGPLRRFWKNNREAQSQHLGV